MLFSAHQTKTHRMSDHPITDGANLHHLDRLVSASLHHKVTHHFLLWNNEYFVEKYQKPVPISCSSSNIHPPIDHSCNHQPSLWCLPNGDFSIFFCFSIFICWHSPIRKSFPSPIPIYLLINIDSPNLISSDGLSYITKLFILMLQFSQIRSVRAPCTCLFGKQV